MNPPLPMLRPLLFEDDRAVAVEQHAVSINPEELARFAQA
jgi:hypothetical protein